MKLIDLLNRPKILLFADGITDSPEGILMLKRNIQPKKGYWHYPGGMLETGESPVQAVKREFMEETGLEIKVKTISHIRIDPGMYLDETKLIFVYIVEIVGGTLRINEESTEARFFRVKDLPRKRVENERSHILWIR